MKPSIAIVLDTRYKNRDNLYYIKLRATFSLIKKGKKKFNQQYYSLKHAVSEKDFQAITEGAVRNDKLRDIRKDITAIEARVNEFLKSKTWVNQEIFEQFFSSTAAKTVGDVFNLIIKDMDGDGRIGSRNLYIAARNSFARFADPNLTKRKTRKAEDDFDLHTNFYEINSEWLKKYKAWAVKNHTGRTSQAIYLRHLRAVFNKAIEKRIINPDLYPFGKFGHKIVKTQSRKIALSEYDKNRLLSLEEPELQQSIDFWAFSYFSYGLNMMDIALLKVMDLTSDLIVIQREKTKNTDTEGTLLNIPLRNEAKEIIRRQGNKTLNPNDYVFPILNPGLTPNQIKNRVKGFTGKINEGLAIAQKKLELDIPLTTYTARHTFASIALEKGASLEFIQHALGHASMETTKVYTSGFGIKTKKAIGAKIYDS